MYQTLNINIPHSDSRVELDLNALPVNVRQRLMELGATAHIRSAVNSARSGDTDKAVTAAKDAAKANKKSFDEKSFRSSYEPAVDPEEVATNRIEALMNGEIRAARGESGANKLLAAAVKNNILTVLKSKGKAHKEALAMVGDDPFAFIDRTARKRAGEGEGADARYAEELTKLNAQYVDPARSLIGNDEGEGEGEEAAGDLL